MRTFWCPDCRNGHVVMKENLESKKGFAKQLILECTAWNCKYSKSLYTSGTVHKGKASEVKLNPCIKYLLQRFFLIIFLLNPQKSSLSGREMNRTESWKRRGKNEREQKT